MDNPADIAQFVGRFHIVLLHLPIGFLVVLGALELASLNPKWRQAAVANRFILYLTVPATLLTAGCGWLLADEGGYQERLLFLHRWTGVALAAAVCGLLVLHWRGWSSVFRVGTWACVGLAIVVGHFGGSLTHGSDYLTHHAPAWMGGRAGSEDSQPAAGSGFAAVQPIFSDYCISCHGPEKDKGGLRLDTWEHLMTGGDSGPGIAPGDPDASLIIKRITLPVDDDDHMPPEGKLQPEVAHIELIRAWVLAGGAE